MKRALINKVMKKTLATSAILIITAASVGINAKEALIDVAESNVGGFGGPAVKISEIQGERVIEMGGLGGATFTKNNQSIFLGGGGYGLTNELVLSGNDILEMGYGGFIAGYTFRPESLIHVKSLLLLGGGAVVLRDSLDPVTNADAGTFFVSELTVQVDINLTEFLEVGIGGSYLIASDPNIAGLDAADLTRPSLVISFQIGGL